MNLRHEKKSKAVFYGETDLVENDDLVFMIYLEDLESGYTEVDLADEIMFEAKEILESFLQIEGATGTEATLESAGLEAFLKVQNSVQIGNGELVNLHFLLKNHSKTPLHLLKWYTPLEGIAGDIFDIIRDGQPIPYLGILATRGNPSPESYVLLEPGESAYAEINLTSAYDFSQPGTYTIKFRAPRISHLARSEAEMARTLDELVPVYIPSNEISERMIGSLTGIGLPVRRTTDEVRGMIEAYPRDQKPDLVEELTLPVEEISTEDAWEALQTQIFRVSGGIFLNESYLIRGFEVIQLGTALGGQGLTSLVVSDLDQDGQAELLFIYSFGSGLHQSRIGMFAPAYDGIGTSEEDMGYLGDLSLSSEDRSHIGVRVLEAVPDSLKLRCLDTIGYLSIEQIDMREGLVLKIYKLPPDEILEKLITTR